MKILKWLLILLVSIPIVLITSVYVRNKAIGPAGWAEDNTVKALKAYMKDPDSMVVRSSYTLSSTNADGDMEIRICGIVDGKNSFGGYTGGTRFVSKSVRNKRFETFDTNFVKIEDSEETARALKLEMLSGFDKVYWNEYCVDSAHPPTKPSKL
ncbi:MAG: hypothetical protein HY253_06685 [Burkholderiales bacterium]|nr:hypothetical protein [Burkholderiales bacterium]